MGFTDGSPAADATPMMEASLPATTAPVDPMLFSEAVSPAAVPAAAYADPFQGVPVVQPAGNMTKTIPEMTELRRWEDQHERELEDVAVKEEAKKKERRKAAEDELQKWHEE